MGDEYTAKTFKSGNSVALRLPKGLGISEGIEMKVREDRGSFILEPVDKPKRKFNIEKIWGCGAGSGLKPIADEDRTFEHRALLWDDPDWLAKIERGE